MSTAKSFASSGWRVRVIAAAAALLSLVPHSRAQAAAAEATDDSDSKSETVRMNPYVLEEKNVVGWNSQMTFSGRHSAGELLELPTAISIITADFMKDIGATNLMGVMEYAASGVNNRVAYREDFTVRGFRQAPLRDGTPYQNYGFLTLYDIDAVEVIKGPDALMFNTYGNISGGVNFVTKSPSPVQTGDINFTVGNFGTYIGSITARGPATKDKTVRYRVTAGKQLQAGWQGQGTDSANYHNNSLYSASIDWDVTKKLLVRFSGGEQRERARDYGSGIIDPVTGKVSEISKHGFSLGTNWSFYNLDTERGTAEAILSVTPELTFRWRSTSYYTFWNYDQPTAQGQNLNPAEYPNYTVVNNIYAEKYVYTVLNVNSYADMTWVKRMGWADNQLSAGMNYFENHSNYDLYDNLLPAFVIGAPISSRPPLPLILVASGTGPQTQASYSVVRNGGWSTYVQDTLKTFHDRLIMAAGVLIVTPSTNNQAKRGTVPNFGVVYRLTPGVSAYAAYGKSFTPQVGFDVFGTPLVNQLGTSKEAGFKFNALNEHLFGTIDYFDIVVSNQLQQVYGKNLAGLFVFGNAQVGQISNKGFEAEMGWVQPIGPGEWSTYATGYSASPKDVNGNQPHAAVKEKYTAFTKYGFTTGPAKGFEAGIGYSDIGASPGVGFATMPAYSLWTAFAGYSWKHYKLTFNADNLLDKKGIITGAEGPGLLALNPPFSFKVTIARTW